MEEGAGTRFHELDLTVQPKQGRVLLWPSVLDEDPMAVDDRTEHEALPVISGVKYGMRFTLQAFSRWAVVVCLTHNIFS